MSKTKKRREERKEVLMSNEWIRCEDELPPTGELVMTKVVAEGESYRERKLIREQRSPEVMSMWFLDHGLYVYYEPTHWKAL